MKTTKEFIDRLKTDEAFAKEIAEKSAAQVQSGETKDYKEILIPLGAEYGYELDEDELDDLYEKASGELSEEELGKVAGGTTPFFLYLGISIASAASLSYSISLLITED